MAFLSNSRRRTVLSDDAHGNDSGTDSNSASEEIYLQGPESIQAQVLLTALRGFIIPLVRAAIGGDPRKENQVLLGAEAQNFLSALQGFISSTAIPSQQDKQVEIEVDLEEAYTDTDAYTDGGTDTDTDLYGSDTLVAKDQLLASTRDPLDYMDGIDWFWDPPPSERPLEKVLVGLRQHVFNAMPIRLLSWQCHDTKLKISLLERSGIYAYLAEKLQEEFDEEGFLSDMMKKTHERTTEKDMEKTVIAHWVSRTAKYAILSHTWIRSTPGELTYGDWSSSAALDSEKPGYQKVVNFCKAAWEDHGLTLGWMDTVCINKNSSSELDESIRSMYNWYRRADVCITYLAGTTTLSDMHLDPWFTRGWTLQELLAPNSIKFYNGDWQQLVQSSDNDKYHSRTLDQIRKATTITQDELRHKYPSGIPISRRMQLAAMRNVTREEDAAYSLMGIFNVSISTAYGEGANRAFFRLVKEILGSSQGVLDIFNWASNPPYHSARISSLLPSSPQDYLHRYAAKLLYLPRPIKPLTLTHLGLRIPILLMPAISIQDASIKCKPIGDYYATIKLMPASSVIPTFYSVLDDRISEKSGWSRNYGSDIFQMTLGVLNVEGDDTSVYIPTTCLAVCLQCDESPGRVTTSGLVEKTDTDVPIVFELSKRYDMSDSVNDDIYGYRIKRSQLEIHGMQLVTKYL